MNADLIKKLQDKLTEHIINCGDNRGRDGEYLSDAANEIEELLVELLES